MYAEPSRHYRRLSADEHLLTPAYMGWGAHPPLNASEESRKTYEKVVALYPQVPSGPQASPDRASFPRPGK